MPLPWTVTSTDVSELKTAYGETRLNDSLTTIHVYNHNSYKVPGLAIFSLYMVIAAFVILNTIRRIVSSLAPKFTQRCRRSLRFWRSELIHAPLFGYRHATSYVLFRRKWLPVRAPLRLHAILLAALLILNISVILFGYTTTSGEVNVFLPGASSQHEQMLRYCAHRAGTLAIGQLPLVFLLAGRRSPLCFLLGLDFADAMVFHRWVARLVWLHANIHGFINVGLRIAHHRAEDPDSPLKIDFYGADVSWGIFTLLVFYCMTILAYGQLRTRAYEAFVIVHIVLGVLALVGLYLHLHLIRKTRFMYALGLIFASIGAWALDRVVRMCNRIILSVQNRNGIKLVSASIDRYSSSVVRLRVQLPLSRVKVPEDPPALWNTHKISAGQSVRLLMPVAQWFSDHPFSVMATGLECDRENGRDVGYIDLLIRQQQGLTQQLSSHVGTTKDGKARRRGFRSTKEVSVILEGPYGHSPQAAVCKSDGLILYAGGVGLSACLPWVQQAAVRQPQVPCAMFWMIRDEALLDVLIDQLRPVADQIAQIHDLEKADRCCITINVHLTTGTQTGAGSELSTTLAGEIDSGSPLIRLVVFRHRADLRSAMYSHHLGFDDDQQQESRLTVFSCGPASLCDSVRREARLALSSGTWQDVGYVEECFNW
ncbi:ferric-chelate reductase [Tilletia horrida]|nr:ferric-chelate reductase [Tilletia horrida]